MFVVDFDMVLADQRHLLPLINLAEPTNTELIVKLENRGWVFTCTRDFNTAYKATNGIKSYYLGESLVNWDLYEWLAYQPNFNVWIPKILESTYPDAILQLAKQYKRSSGWYDRRNKGYEEYYSRLGEALPIEAGCYMLKALLATGLYTDEVYIVTGRRESSRTISLNWLNQHVGYTGGKFMGRPDNMRMRSHGDYRPAHEVKRDLILQIQRETNCSFKDVIVYDDSKECIDMYKALGCYTNHVQIGDV